MRQKEYVDAVLRQLIHLTEEEKNSVGSELNGHIEDHICDLLELGYEPELAEERAMSFMGDPEEMGRELEKQYPRHWLILGHLAVFSIALLSINIIFSLGMLFHLSNSLEARFDSAPKSNLETVLGEQELNIHHGIGNDVLRITGVSVGYDQGMQYMENCRTAEVTFNIYDWLPNGVISERIPSHIVLKNQREEMRWDGGWGGGSDNWTAAVTKRYVEVRPGDTYVLLCYSDYGETWKIKIPLPEVEL